MDVKVGDQQNPFWVQESRFGSLRTHYEPVPTFHHGLVDSDLAGTTRQTVTQSTIRERR